jgi:hypothetical protein
MPDLLLRSPDATHWSAQAQSGREQGVREIAAAVNKS